MTPDQFAEQIKKKFPQYQGMDNLELTTRIINKYPQYERRVQIPKVETPDTGERVGETITQAGQTLREQIGGEGELAGESPLVRGTAAAATAATAIPQTAIQAIPGAFGERIRAGLERLGSAVGEQVGKVTRAIGETPLFQEAAGRQEVGPSGETTFVPNDLGFLDDALKVAANVGEVAEITAGAGVGPRAVTSGVSRTAAAVADVGREALERTIVASGNLADRATPKSVRTALRLNPPETRAKAVEELENAYQSGLVLDRKAVNNKLDKLARSESFGAVTLTRQGLIRELAEEGYIPKIEGDFAKFDDVFDDISSRQRQLMDDLDNELAPLQGVEVDTSLERIRQTAEDSLRQSPQISAGLESSIRELDRFFKSFQEKFGDRVSPLEVNAIRKEMNRVTKAFKDEDLFRLDAAEAVAKMTRDRLDEVVPTGRVSDLNKEWARLKRVDETAKILNNEVVEVGLLGRKLGSYVGTIGASLAGLSIAGPGGLVVASIFAQLGSDALATLLRAKKFDPALRDSIIKNIKADPKVVEKLIREASPENKTFLRNLLGVAAVAGAAKVLSEEGKVEKG